MHAKVRNLLEENAVNPAANAEFANNVETTGACRRERPENKKGKVLNYQNKSFRTLSAGSLFTVFPLRFNLRQCVE